MLQNIVAIPTAHSLSGFPLVSARHSKETVVRVLPGFITVALAINESPTAGDNRFILASEMRGA